MHYYLVAGHVFGRDGSRNWPPALSSQPTLLASVAASRPSQPRVRRSLAATAGTACGALVDTSVNLKPTELLNVTLDVLARLAPCLNLGVGKLGHKDLLDTIGADNCRK